MYTKGETDWKLGSSLYTYLRGQEFTCENLDSSTRVSRTHLSEPWTLRPEDHHHLKQRPRKRRINNTDKTTLLSVVTRNRKVSTLAHTVALGDARLDAVVDAEKVDGDTGSYTWTPSTASNVTITRKRNLWRWTWTPDPSPTSRSRRKYPQRRVKDLCTGQTL